MRVETAFTNRQENDLCNLMGWDRMTWLLLSIWVGITDDNSFRAYDAGIGKRQRVML